MDRFDIAFLVGLALLTAGSYLVYPPLALIVPGVFLIGLAVVGGVNKAGGPDGGG